MEVKVLRKVQAANDATADDTRRLLAGHGICMLNVMGGAGCGKTELLERLLPRLQRDLRCAVLEGDLATTRDAERIARLEVPVVQLQTDGCCHLDAWLVFAGLGKLPLEQLDLVIVENVGNLVCPAEFDVGEHARLAVLSLMEGDDKPAKYPLLFSRATAVALSKCDLSNYADFNLAGARKDIAQVNPAAPLFMTGRDQAGDDRLLAWIRETHAAQVCGAAERS